MDSYKPISITASVTLDRSRHLGAPVVLNAAAGLTVTLPAAVGSGDRYHIIVGTTVTSNSDVIKVANSTDIIQGVISVGTDINGVTCPAGGADDTITMNGTTTGGIKGSAVFLQDVASGLWDVAGALVSSGIEATPFSSTV